MNKYTITSPSFEGEMIFEYDLNSHLTVFKNNAVLTDEMVKWLGNHFPMHEEQLTTLLAKSKTLKSDKIVKVPTFEEFWELYDYKVDKAPAQKEWSKLSELERCQAIATLEPYNNYLRLNPSIQKIYPVRFLKNRRFEVDYRKMIK